MKAQNLPRGFRELLKCWLLECHLSYHECQRRLRGYGYHVPLKSIELYFRVIIGLHRDPRFSNHFPAKNK